jgi:predicted acetyltransferase
MNSTYSKFDAAADLYESARIMSLSFGSEIEGSQQWITNKVGHDNMRVIRTGSTVVGTGVRVPMGHYFGGNSVPVVGIAGIAVAPHARGHGVARSMMLGLLNEIRDEGVALSSLYPATTYLYRRVGFEQAGQ